MQTLKTYHDSNRCAWNQAAAAYRKVMQQTVEFLHKGGVSMCPPELSFLKNLGEWCNSAVHLQCAGGEDTLSLLNLGARNVTGIDISEEMINIAREISRQLNARADWVCCDILDTPARLNETADLVYTGRWAVIWIHDLARWAQTIARLLKPNGYFYLFEGHPVTYFFDTKAATLKLDDGFKGYFSGKVYNSQGWTAEYVGDVGISQTISLKNISGRGR